MNQPPYKYNDTFPPLASGQMVMTSTGQRIVQQGGQQVGSPHSACLSGLVAHTRLQTEMEDCERGRCCDARQYSDCLDTLTKSDNMCC